MGKINYKYYTDADAEDVARLMIKNNFGMGRYEKTLTAEKFCEYQAKKGFVFGIVGKTTKNVVSYIGCYQLGAQRVCKEKQIVTGGILLDSKYRLAVFSIADMFSLLLKKIVEMGYLDIISEVYYKNLPSLYMMGKTGFVVLDDTPTVHEDIVLHNYLPAIIKTITTTEIIKNDVITKTMQPLNKRKVLRRVVLDSKGCFDIQWKTDINEYIFTMDSASCRVVGVQVVHNGFIIKQDLNNPYNCMYQNLNILNEKEPITVRFYNREEMISTTELLNEYEKYIYITAPPKTDRIEFLVPDQSCTYTYFVPQQKKERSIKIKPINGFAKYNDITGYLNICRDNKVLFSELWPCLCAPYLESVLEPNVEKKLSFEIFTKDKFKVSYQFKEGGLIREYDMVGEDMISIHTWGKIKEEEKDKLDSLFHFGFLDTNFVVKIYLQNGDCIDKIFRKDDFMYPNYPFIDFQKEAYSNEWVKEVQVFYDKQGYSIKADLQAKCFFQRNYLAYYLECREGIHGEEIDFGKIYIGLL